MAHGDRTRERVLVYCQTHVEHVSPTVREVSEALGLGISTVFKYMCQLEEEGFLKRRGSGTRFQIGYWPPGVGSVTRSGHVITEEDLNNLAEDAEAGYDLEKGYSTAEKKE